MEGGDFLAVEKWYGQRIFQSTPPVEGGDRLSKAIPRLRFISIHATRGGWRPDRRINLFAGVISIHATRGGWRQQLLHRSERPTLISIHATRGGWRQSQVAQIRASLRISIHATRGGWRRVEGCMGWPSQVVFQSTPPVEGGDFGLDGGDARCVKFQSTPPVEGGDGRRTGRGGDHGIFQSTPPVEGGDPTCSTTALPTTNFNPRHPWRVATSLQRCALDLLIFQSTPPVEGGDTSGCVRRSAGGISIHATRGGWRHTIFGGKAAQAIFQSTPPVEGGDDINQYTE